MPNRRSTATEQPGDTCTCGCGSRQQHQTGSGLQTEQAAQLAEEMDAEQQADDETQPADRARA